MLWAEIELAALIGIVPDPCAYTEHSYEELRGKNEKIGDGRCFAKSLLEMIRF